MNRARVLLRGFHTSSSRFLKNVEEVNIPVPWGHIAGKWWGDMNHCPAIAVHGLLDNANSFDKLMPLLDHPSFLCIDLPGHGKSSHIPKGMMIYYSDYLILLRFLIKKHFKADKITLLGHSYGSSLCFTYAGIFPNDVELMINLDCSRLATAALVERTVSDFRNSMNGFLSLEEESESTDSGYSWEDTVKHLHEVRVNLGMPLSKEGCELIAQRGTKLVGDLWYRFSFDTRLKERSFGRYTKPTNLTFARRITCPVLNIQASKGLSAIKNSPINSTELKEHLDELAKHSKSFINAVVEGFHHIHIDQPNNVASVINVFTKST